MVRPAVRLLLLLALYAGSASAGPREDWAFLVKHAPPPDAAAGAGARPGREALLPDETSEIAVAWSLVVGAYQRFISSQSRRDVCTFLPSCSRFGREAVRTRGVLRGVLMTSDRIQRCHGANRQYYPVDPATQKCLDPVWRNGAAGGAEAGR
jgi:putative component of membrane protein insertase Oxa1/YidC/SpoIIIJ protein YidD